MMKFIKETITLLGILLPGTVLLGQQAKHKTEPFIIQGQITNCPEKQLEIFFRDQDEQIFIDTIYLDPSGRFYLKTFKVQQPQQTSIGHNRTRINHLFVAPGYNLAITGDGKDTRTLFESKKIAGIGAQSNEYQFLLDSIILARGDSTDWLNLAAPDLLSYLEHSQQLKDSLAHAVFDRRADNDKFLKYFGTVVRLDNQFSRLYMLVMHVTWKDYDYEKSISFVRNNFDNRLLDNLYEDMYLISPYYKDWLITGEWLNYLRHLDVKKDATLRDEKDYKFKKISTTYSGKVKEFALYDRLQRAIELCKSLSVLNDCVAQYATYATPLKNEHYKQQLAVQLEEKKADLLRNEAGKPAPTFVLESSEGKQYSLDDFKNKVVYLDLWASWCGPCREETPYLRELYKKYKGDDRVVFISIAVNDGADDWKKALAKDRPEWLQLLDREGTVAKNYFANMIPQFVLINKQGNIVDFDAPSPSDKEEIEKLLEREMGK